MQEATEFFVSMYRPIVVACERLSLGQFRPVIARKCLFFLRSISEPSFLISMFTFSLCLSTTRPSSVKLQLSDIDAYRAIQSIESAKKALQKYREDSSYEDIFD